MISASVFTVHTLQPYQLYSLLVVEFLLLPLFHIRKLVKLMKNREAFIVKKPNYNVFGTRVNAEGMDMLKVNDGTLNITSHTLLKPLFLTKELLSEFCCSTQLHLLLAN